MNSLLWLSDEEKQWAMCDTLLFLSKKHCLQAFVKEWDILNSSPNSSMAL